MWQSFEKQQSVVSQLIGNKIDKYNMNVSNEVLTGETLAGRPVYQRLVDIGVLPNNTSKTINTCITNAYYFWVDPTYSMVISGGAEYPFPYVDPANRSKTYRERPAGRCDNTGKLEYICWVCGCKVHQAVIISIFQSREHAML